MTNTEKRIKELCDKMTRIGITRDERVELTALEARAEVAKLQEIEANKAKVQLQQENAEIQKFRAETQQMLAEADRDAGYLEILRTEFSAKLLASNEANRTEVFALYDNDVYNADPLGAVWFASRSKDDPKLVSRFVWTSRPDP